MLLLFTLAGHMTNKLSRKFVRILYHKAHFLENRNVEFEAGCGALP
jgi:hypothetical protein